MEEILNHQRTETSFVLFCSSFDTYVSGYNEDIVAFNPYYPKEFKTLEMAIQGKKDCKKVIKKNSFPQRSPYRLSIKKRVYTWQPGGNTRLTETYIRL